VPKKNTSREFYCIILFKKNLQLKHTEFLLRFLTMLCRKQHAEISIDASKIMILMSKIKNALAQKFEDEELEALLHEGSCQTLAELAESLEVDHTTFSKRLKVLEMQSRTLGIVRIETERHGTTSFHV